MNSHAPTQNAQPELRRALGFTSICFYGVGTIIGAGIYVLVGKVGLQAGIHLPLAFILAGIIATFTALSYAELSSRFPVSAGSAIYIHNTWKRAWLSKAVGLMVITTGIVSAATIANGFIGYLHLFIPIPGTLAIIGLILLLTLLACWGIQESAATVTLITLIEISGLIYVLYVGGSLEPVNNWSTILVPQSVDHIIGIVAGSFLAFYAFIGFEDMVNMAEEVKSPRKTLPRAILIAIALSTLLYVSVALIAIRATPLETLTSSDAPLADVIGQSGRSTLFIGLISLFAVINGALVQIIMASRLLYGLSKEGLAPKCLCTLNRKKATPITSTLLVSATILVLALWLPLTALAKITSFIMLTVFCLVNASLFALKCREKEPPPNAVNYPKLFPALGFSLTLLLLIS